MSKQLTILDLTLIRDSLLKVTPSRQQADQLWDIIEKLNKLIEGERVEQSKRKPTKRD